jgi:hypothetical protein
MVRWGHELGEAFPYEEAAMIWLTPVDETPKTSNTRDEIWTHTEYLGPASPFLRTGYIAAPICMSPLQAKPRSQIFGGGRHEREQEDSHIPTQGPAQGPGADFRSQGR